MHSIPICWRKQAGSQRLCPRPEKHSIWIHFRVSSTRTLPRCCTLRGTTLPQLNKLGKRLIWIRLVRELIGISGVFTPPRDFTKTQLWSFRRQLRYHRVHHNTSRNLAMHTRGGDAKRNQQNY